MAFEVLSLIHFYSQLLIKESDDPIQVTSSFFQNPACFPLYLSLPVVFIFDQGLFGANGNPFVRRKVSFALLVSTDGEAAKESL
jgi:hypothetical protein